MHTPSLIIGTRASPLALIQGQIICKALIDSGIYHTSVKLTSFVTKGDCQKDLPLQACGGKGLFTQEIENALLENRIHLAVHSLKDMPVIQRENLRICAYFQREDPRDCFVSPHFKRLADIPSGGVIGTASLRRQSFLRHAYPSLRFQLLRGNVNTRLKKISQNHTFAGTLLAYAGLKRMRLEHMCQEILCTKMMVPAPGQGVLAVQCREDFKDIALMRTVLNHSQTERTVTAERAFLKCLEGNCHTPLGAYCVQKSGETLHLRGKVGHPSGKMILETEMTGTDPECLGKDAAQKLLRRMSKGLQAWLDISHPAL